MGVEGGGKCGKNYYNRDPRSLLRVMGVLKRERKRGWQGGVATIGWRVAVKQFI